jgi:hypothetical protein
MLLGAGSRWRASKPIGVNATQLGVPPASTPGDLGGFTAGLRMPTTPVAGGPTPGVVGTQSTPRIRLSHHPVGLWVPELDATGLPTCPPCSPTALEVWGGCLPGWDGQARAQGGADSVHRRAQVTSFHILTRESLQNRPPHLPDQPEPVFVWIGWCPPGRNNQGRVSPMTQFCSVPPHLFT